MNKTRHVASCPILDRDDTAPKRANSRSPGAVSIPAASSQPSPAASRRVGPTLESRSRANDAALSRLDDPRSTRAPQRAECRCNRSPRMSASDRDVHNASAGRDLIPAHASPDKS
ncbi:hypothetical protein CERSUDRAFT_96806 [Gelatoporia subvermispora B]|uniref:Uncharacterized protein n=1 Tax=Ceriporiopsis subvermispora (strain B) TaxID=914234 RepID=M2R8Z3_CERS8|nr:hypothetical protein CERSUDRAFT_96806 [Gelatoporia subvermispora B]